MLSFQYRNTNEHFLGVDVHPELGLVAAAHDAFDSSTAISLHNLWTGKVVKEIPFSTGSRYRDNLNIHCLKLDVEQETDEVRCESRLHRPPYWPCRIAHCYGHGC